MKKEKKKYSLFGNIRYAYQTLFQKCGWMRLAVPGAVLTHLGSSILYTVTLPVLVASITEQRTASHFLLVVSGMLLL